MNMKNIKIRIFIILLFFNFFIVLSLPLTVHVFLNTRGDNWLIFPKGLRTLNREHDKIFFQDIKYLKDKICHIINSFELNFRS